MKRIIALTIVSIMAASAFAEPLANTKENRMREAKRYLKATPPEEMMEDMAKNMAQNMPESERQEFIDLMTKHLDMDAFAQLMTDSMVKHFTAEELKALADFYSSPVGKSAMKKFGAYMADIMPHIQVEIMKAYTKAMESKIEKKPAQQ